MRTLILGLGDPGLAAERMGLEVARGLHAKLGDPDVDIIETSSVEMNLFDLAAGYDKVVVVDCIPSGEGDVGELRRLGLADLKLVAGRRRERDTEYRATIEVDADGKEVAPFEISIYAIEMGDGTTYDEEFAQIAREAVPRLVAQIAAEEFGTSPLESEWL
jgi:hydrogenase maturation protease